MNWEIILWALESCTELIKNFGEAELIKVKPNSYKNLTRAQYVTESEQIHPEGVYSKGNLFVLYA